MKWSVDSTQDATAQIVQYIRGITKTKHSILLLVSGGSAITIEADVLRQLTYCPEIVGILPMDERYGLQGHNGSNIAQLNKELHNNCPVAVHDVLTQNLPFNDTVEHYSNLVQDMFARADHIVGIFGVGADGHTAGILPHSPSTTDTVSTVIGYTWQDYDRMTLGTNSLTQINTAFVLAYGDSKKRALHRIQARNEQFEALPAKVLYDIQDVTIYNDFIKSEEVA